MQQPGGTSLHEFLTRWEKNINSERGHPVPPALIESCYMDFTTAGARAELAGASSGTQEMRSGRIGCRVWRQTGFAA
jgi:hypothetical protein